VTTADTPAPPPLDDLSGSAPGFDSAGDIKPRDRLSFALFLALSLHAAVILGIGFRSEDPGPESSTMEVTLAVASDAEAPEDAAFLAQSNQLGSGAADEELEITATEHSDFAANELNPVVTEAKPLVPDTRLEKRELLTTVTNAEDEATVTDETPMPELDSSLNPAERPLDELAREIASLEARIALEQQAEARRPRVKRLTSVSTRSAAEAGYLNMWRQKVERIGNTNFPGGSQYGNLRMLVVIRYDGSLKEARILESSGHKQLDDAALRIVRLAAPYQDFPVDMRKSYDELEIIRTWQFSRSGTSLGS